MIVAVEAMQVALRVLQATCEKRNPNPDGVEALKRYAPLLADAPVDELACDVINQA